MSFKNLSFVFSQSPPLNPVPRTVYFINGPDTKKILVYDEIETSPLSVETPGFIDTISGNAGSATKLLNARTINGTEFNGTANITTANWGTAREITLGSTTKSVNGGSNVSWSLAEIGLKPATKTEALTSAGSCSITPTTFQELQSWLTFTSSATTTLNLNDSRNFNITIGQNTTFAQPTIGQLGACGEILLTLTGNFVVSWNTAWKFVDEIPTISASGEQWVISYKVVTSSLIICSAGKIA